MDTLKRLVEPSQDFQVVLTKLLISVLQFLGGEGRGGEGRGGGGEGGVALLTRQAINNTYLISINFPFIHLWTLKVAEVRDDVFVLLPVLSLQPEDWRDEVGETKQLRYDGIASADQLQDKLPTHIPLGQEVQPRHDQPLSRVLLVLYCCEAAKSPPNKYNFVAS